MNKPKQSTLFLPSLLFGLLVLAAVGAWVGVQVFRVTEEDQESYARILKRSEVEQEAVSKEATQWRTGTQRQLLFTRNEQRLQAKLWSSSSQLFFREEGGESRLVEEMRDMHTILQEKSGVSPSGPFQDVKVLTSATAFYDYHTQNLIAHEVKVQQYRLSGTDFIEDLTPFQPQMEGTAVRADLSLADDQVTVSFTQFKADIYR